jgi:hypothetical protein
MTREEIINTEWAKSLLEHERKNNAAPGTHAEAINIVANRTQVRVISLDGDGVEIYVDTFVLEVAETVDAAIEWCKQFDLPIEAVNGEPYHDDSVSTYRELVRQLAQWLKHRASDAKLPGVEQAAYINVLNKIEQLKG